ncbi:isoflavone reductase family protein (NmrA-like family protein) [Colletotrichum truncatum]|uniref:Isoflavone reductase family protein (NmrA-like family protein) n=1 Tax=Colletotrichum truncatum TaxID=5467 RepID=A0ACC3ZAH8_COLTU|nr:isoflavone reductase family protein (NmrA-like family protein) [Colletotrichum truncatum]KAF6796268.1 isoflavone reductase family protein (NmrA-like family protein) [Colletotrichum truncatum]
MSSSKITNVLVVGANGNVGKSAIKALLDEKFNVSGLTRDSSTAVLPEGVKHLKTDFSEESLVEAFTNQDAVISTISGIQPGGSLTIQNVLVDVAIKAGVKIFVPSEYGIDTSDPSASKFIPFLSDKIETLNYLKEREDKISWTALVTGAMFDWGLNIPGFGGWNVAARTVTIFDGGDTPYEATNLDQVGRAIAKSLKKPGLTRNQYVYANSFTITQNETLKALEKATGDKFAVSQGTVDELWQEGASQVENGQPLGTLAMVAGATYGKGGLSRFSVTKGLWNERLGLPQENLEEFIREYVAGKK